MCTVRMVLVVCGRRSTVRSGVTVPLEATTTPTSWRLTGTALTVMVGCAPPPLPAAGPLLPWACAPPC